MTRWWHSKRTIVGVMILAALGAATFSLVWGVMATISVPDWLRPLREDHPRFIVVWNYVLYFGAAIVSLLPAALFWVLNGGERRVRSGMLAAMPLIGLLVADSAHVALAFDVDCRGALLLWDSATIVLAAIWLFVTLDVLRRLTMRWSKRGRD